MKKNNKGFTLIELLAAVVVLGLLVAISVPLIAKNITSSRSKVYVQDANKFISLAEYKLSSNSIKIQKPDPGNCIVFGLDYLNDGSISNPPNKGTYNPDLSYVVVKNNGGKLEYSVSLVEELKGDGGFSGVKLSTKSQLNNSFSYSRITGFEKDELICLSYDACNRNDISESRVINENLINERIDDKDNHYVELVEKVYLKETLEQGEPSNISAPKIKKSYVDFDSSVSENNTIGFVVYVNAIDNDSPGENELSVCIKDSPNKDDIFPLIGRDDRFCESYTSGNDYYKKFSYTITPEEEDAGVSKYFYVSVYDNNNNVNTAKFEKRINKNVAPTIKISASKRDFDKSNLHIARLKLLSIRDDRSKMTDLSYCVNVSGNESECVYQSYNDTFKEGYYDYTIRDSSGKPLVKPDGNKYTIYVFAKDSYGAYGVDSVEYEVSSVTKPEVTYDVFNDALNGKNDLSGYLVITNVDDQYDMNEIKIKLTVEGVTTEYQYNADLRINYNFSKIKADGKSGYDGENRTLTLEVENQYHEVVKKNVVISNIYKNKAPTINIFSITGPGYVALDGDYEENKPNVILNVTDDFDSSLRYCITEEIGCISDADFNYIEANNTISFEHNFKYNGKNSRSLTVFVKDNSGAVTSEVVEYPEYKNKPPTIEGEFTIVSVNNSYSDEVDNNTNNINNEINTNNVIVDMSGLSVKDDSDDYEIEFCYKVGSENVCYVNSEEGGSSSFYDFDSLKDLLADGIVLVDENGKRLKHNGQTIKGYFVVRDRYNAGATSSEVEYTLYKNNPPTVTNIVNKRVVVDESIKTNESEETEYALVSYYKVYDEDPNDTYSVCVSTSSECEDYIGPFIASNSKDEFIVETISDAEYGAYTVIVDDGHQYIDIEDSFVRTNTYNIDSNSMGKSLYLFIKDSEDNVLDDPITLYGICSSVDPSEESNITYTPEGTNVYDSINTGLCNGICTSDYSRKHNIYKPYTLKSEFHDLIGNFCGPYEESVNLDCSYYTCVGTPGTTTENVIGTVRVKKEWSTDWLTNDGTIQRVQCHGFYTRYRAYVNGNTESADLLRMSGSEYEICDTLIDKYSYFLNTYSGYIRVDDSKWFNSDIYNCETIDDIYTCEERG